MARERRSDPDRSLPGDRADRDRSRCGRGDGGTGVPRGRGPQPTRRRRRRADADELTRRRPDDHGRRVPPGRPHTVEPDDPPRCARRRRRVRPDASARRPARGQLGHRRGLGRARGRDLRQPPDPDALGGRTGRPSEQHGDPGPDRPSRRRREPRRPPRDRHRARVWRSLAVHSHPSLDRHVPQPWRPERRPAGPDAVGFRPNRLPRGSAGVRVRRRAPQAALERHRSAPVDRPGGSAPHRPPGPARGVRRGAAG